EDAGAEPTDTVDDGLPSDVLDQLRYDFDSAYAWTKSIVVTEALKIQLPTKEWESVGKLPIEIPEGFDSEGNVESSCAPTAVPTFKLATFQPHGHVWVAFPNLCDKARAIVPEEYRKQVFAWVTKAANLADPFSVSTILPNNQAAIARGHKTEGLCMRSAEIRSFDTALHEWAERFCPGFRDFFFIHTIRGTKQQTYFFRNNPARARESLDVMVQYIARTSLESDSWFIDKGLEWKRGDSLLHPKAGSAADLLHALFPTVAVDAIRDQLTAQNTRTDVTALIYPFECFSVDTSRIAELQDLVVRGQSYSTIKHTWYHSSPKPKGIWKTMQSHGLVNAAALDHGIGNIKAVVQEFKYAMGHAEAVPDSDSEEEAPAQRYGEEAYALAVRQAQHDRHENFRSSSLRFEVTVPYGSAVTALSHVTVADLAPHVYCVPLIHLWQWFDMRVSAALLVMENLQQQPKEVRCQRRSLVLGGLVTAILQSIAGRPPEGSSYDKYFEKGCRIMHNPVTGSTDLRDQTAFWIPDIQEIPGGHWVVPVEVADRVPSDFLARSYGQTFEHEIQLAMNVRRTLASRHVNPDAVQTQSRRVESALDALRSLENLVLDECQAAVDADAWDRLEREYDQQYPDPHQDPRYHMAGFASRPRRARDANLAIWQVIVLWVRNAHHYFPHNNAGEAYSVISKADIDRLVLGIGEMRNLDFSQRLRCMVVAVATPLEQREIFERFFSLRILEANRTVGQGYGSWGSLKVYTILLTNVSMPAQRKLIFQAIWNVWKTFAWVPWARNDRIYATDPGSVKWQAVGLDENARGPRLAIFDPDMLATIRVAEENRAGVAREQRAAEKAKAKALEEERLAKQKAEKALRKQQELDRIAAMREAQADEFLRPIKVEIEERLWADAVRQREAARAQHFLAFKNSVASQRLDEAIVQRLKDQRDEHIADDEYRINQNFEDAFASNTAELLARYLRGEIGHEVRRKAQTATQKRSQEERLAAERARLAAQRAAQAEGFLKTLKAAAEEKLWQEMLTRRRASTDHHNAELRRKMADLELEGVPLCVDVARKLEAERAAAVEADAEMFTQEFDRENERAQADLDTRYMRGEIGPEIRRSAAGRAGVSESKSLPSNEPNQKKRSRSDTVRAVEDSASQRQPQEISLEASARPRAAKKRKIDATAGTSAAPKEPRVKERNRNHRGTIMKF
ncbi:hypothetical protein EXIGLDRAFT_781943, partial [Exidia glandulosa HHB12029]